MRSEGVSDWRASTAAMSELAMKPDRKTRAMKARLVRKVTVTARERIGISSFPDAKSVERK